MSMPRTRHVDTSFPPVLSNLYAVGRSSLSEMNTIIPAMNPNVIPYTRGPKIRCRTSHPNSAPGEGGRERGLDGIFFVDNGQL